MKMGLKLLMVDRDMKKYFSLNLPIFQEDLKIDL